MTVKNHLFQRHETDSAKMALRRRLQKLLAGFLFPAGKDWYAEKGYGKKPTKSSPGSTLEERFAAFVAAQRDRNNQSCRYYNDFEHLDLSIRYVPSRLADKRECQLEVMTAATKERSSNLPGAGKHIVYFPGANTYYQACFRDISDAARKTGATVHAFNFPGTGASTGRVTELNDLVNAGMAVVNSLLRQGVKPDDIVLQGDCYGAAVAMEVKKQFELQSHLKLRIVMNNAFKSFKSVAVDIIAKKLHFTPGPKLNALVKKLLVYTGWHVTPGKNFKEVGPYNYYIQHSGDLVLSNRTMLLAKVQANRIKKHMSGQQSQGHDWEPRARLELNSVVGVKPEAVPRLAEKFGVSKTGQVNAHFADLCECETQDGQSAYTGSVNPYLEASNQYVAEHPQAATIPEKDLPRYLEAARYSIPRASDMRQFEQIDHAAHQAQQHQRQHRSSLSH